MLTEKNSKSFANGKVYVLVTDDGYPIETTDTFLPFYTKDCINEHINELKNYHLGTREDRWMIGVSCMSGCPVRCAFCFDSDTNILMSDLSYKKIKDIHKGDKVVSTILAKKPYENSRDKTTKYLKASEVVNVFKRNYTGLLYTIYLDNGSVLKVTENHPIAVVPKNCIDNHRIYFFKANELKSGDMLLGVKSENSFMENIRGNDSWLFGWLNGFLVGDGTYNKVANRTCHFWQVSQSDKDLITVFAEICDYFGVKRSSVYINNIGKDRMSMYKKNYVLRIGEAGIEKLNELYRLYNNDLNYKKGYVAGFWDAEGYSFYNNSTARFCNTDYDLLLTVKSYLSDLSFDSEIKLYNSSRQVGNKKSCYMLETAISRLDFNLIFKPFHKKSNYFSDSSKKYKGTDIVKIKRVEVREVKDYIVYNFETTEHTYIANNVVVHNCATGQLKRCRNLTAEEIVEQVKFILEKNPDFKPSNCKEFKINYTRMGEPALNWEEVKRAVKLVDELLPDTRVHHYISTIGVKGTDFSWIKDNITLQVSLHSLDEDRRNDLIPFKNKMTIEELGQIRTESELKTTVNMTLVDTADFDIEKLTKWFDPEYFFIKVSPINPNPISEGNGLGKGVIKAENLV